MSSWAGRGSMPSTALPRPAMYPQAGVFHSACEKRSQAVPCRFSVYNDPPVFPGRVDPSEQFRERRRRSRRRRRIRGLIALACLVGGIVALALNARFISGDDADAQPAAPPATAGAAPPPAPSPRCPPRSAAFTSPRRSGVDPRQARRVHRAQGLLPEHDRARRQGRERRGRLHPSRRAARAPGRARRRATTTRAPSPRRRMLPALPDRPGGRVPGPAPGGRTARHGDPDARRARSGRRQAGLGWTNPYDRARLGLQRRRRRGRRAGRIRRDHVRLRPVPHRRRRRRPSTPTARVLRSGK